MIFNLFVCKQCLKLTLPFKLPIILYEFKWQILNINKIPINGSCSLDKNDFNYKGV